MNDIIFAMEKNAERKIYLDHLRVAAMIAIVVLHVAAQSRFDSGVSGLSWQVFNIYDGLVRWGVAIFVMISGALFLGRDIPVKRIYTGHILRLAIAYFVWSALYAALTRQGVHDILMETLHGHYHMWFIPMMIGLYMCIPVLRLISSNKKVTGYYLILSFLFALLIPYCLCIIHDLSSGGIMIEMIDALTDVIQSAGPSMMLGFPAVFLLGYYLDTVSLSQKARIVIYILGAAGFLATVGLNALIALRTGENCSHYNGNLSLGVILEAVAVFTLFKYHVFRHSGMDRIMIKLSGYCFGVYLAHTAFIGFLDSRLGFGTLSFNPVVSVPCIALVVLTASFAVSALLNHIPLVRDYLV